jgi:ATP-dependent DNA helicase RecG
MQRFVKADTQIMVSTTVIELGCTECDVMVIEALAAYPTAPAQGRVGRGAEKVFAYY